MIKAFNVRTPLQLRALYEIKTDGNRMMDSVARVWKREGILQSANYSNPAPENWARVEFNTDERKCRVYKCFGRRDEQIGSLPYNRALKYCRENLEQISK